MTELPGLDPASIEIDPQFVFSIGDSNEVAFNSYHENQMCQHLVSLSGSTLKDQVQAGVRF